MPRREDDRRPTRPNASSRGTNEPRGTPARPSGGGGLGPPSAHRPTSTDRAPAPACGASVPGHPHHIRWNCPPRGRANHCQWHRPRPPVAAVDRTPTRGVRVRWPTTTVGVGATRPPLPATPPPPSALATTRGGGDERMHTPPPWMGMVLLASSAGAADVVHPRWLPLGMAVATRTWHRAPHTGHTRGRGSRPPTHGDGGGEKVSIRVAGRFRPPCRRPPRRQRRASGSPRRRRCGRRMASEAPTMPARHAR